MLQVLGGILASLPLMSALGISPRQSQIEWTTCNTTWVANPAISCSTLQVPLDYNNPSAGTATLAVAKMPAVGAKLGTIFINPGGPGYGGLSFLDGEQGDRFFNATGRSFDVVSWDPRGSGFSVPSINCFPPKSTVGIGEPTSYPFTFWLGNNASLFTSSSGPTQRDVDTFLTKTDAVDAHIKQFVQNCTERHSGVLQYIGTAATARDLVALADAVQGAGSSINYYGMAYGTVIGVHLMKMFPQRLGKVVFDGVVDPVAYTTKPNYLTYASSLQDANTAYQAFFDACARVGPRSSPDAPGCALASPGSTAQAVQQRLNKIFDNLYQVAQTRLKDFVLLEVLSPLRGISNSPEYWNGLSEYLTISETKLQGLITGNTTATQQRRHLSKRQSEGSTIVDKSLSASTAIECGDSIDMSNITTRAIFEETIRITRDVNVYLGSSLTTDPSLFCHLWPVRAVERIKITPTIDIPGSVIIIGNTAGAITPLGQAADLYRMINAAGTKRFVQHDAVGDTSLDIRSACTQDIIKRYFSEGHLPGSDTLCGVNETPAFLPLLADPVPSSELSTSIISAPIAIPTGPVKSSAPSMLRSFSISYAHLAAGLALILGSMV